MVLTDNHLAILRGRTAKTGAERQGGGSWETKALWEFGYKGVGAGRQWVREK